MTCQGSLFVQRLLAQSAPGSPADWRIRWNWEWPFWFTALVAIVLIGWVARIYLREVSSASRLARLFPLLLRLAAIASAIVMLAQPVVEWFRSGRPHLVVLVDRSGSMGIRDERDADRDASRLEASLSLLTQGSQPLLDRWQSEYDLDLVAFDEQLAGIAPDGLPIAIASEENNGTRLGDAVEYALQELPGPMPAAIVLFTDGIVTQGMPLLKAAHHARSLRVPLFTVALGSPLERPDVALENLLAESVVFPGDRMQLEATLHATGLTGPAQVTLRNELNNRLLAQTVVALSPGGDSQTVRFAIQAESPGELPLRMEVAPLDGETNLENNSLSRTIEVRDKQIRVLLVQSAPSYEYRALKSLLERDPAVALRVFLQEADAEFAEVDNSALREFPTTEQGLTEYDVVLLGDVDPMLLPRHVWDALRQFVFEQGGGLACIAGPRFMPDAFRMERPMQALMPFEIEATRLGSSYTHSSLTYLIEPTALGWHSPSLLLGENEVQSQAVWRGLPPVTWVYPIQSIKPGAQVLAEGRTPDGGQESCLPVILRHYVGRGEVLFHATDETWRWGWRTDDRYFAHYWGQAVRQLGRGQISANQDGVEIQTDRTRYRPGEEVLLQLTFRNAAAAPADDHGVLIELQDDVGMSRKVRLQRRPGYRGVFTTRFEGLSPGKYEAALLQPGLEGHNHVARFEVQRPPRELSRVAADQQTLSEAARISGGKAYTLETVSELAADLPPPLATVVDQLPSQPLWNSHAAIACFVALLTGEWLLRRRYGML